jgi:hypothetical protein
MWTSVGREDRYIRNRKWITPGSIYKQDIYDKNFVEQFADPTGYLIKDMATISAAKHMLESIGCKFYFLSVVPLAVYDDHFGAIFSIDNKIIKLYKEEIDFIKPSIYSVVFNNNWYSRTGFVDENELKREYNIVAGPNWPTWERFVQNDFQGVSGDITKEIESHNFFKRLTVRTDTHPLPSEHLLYLEQILPEFVITDDTKRLVYQTTADILAQQKIARWWNNRRRPERF